MNICFTGNRPNKLGGYNWDNPKNMKIMLKLLKKVESIIENNKDEKFHFICGGALGIDQMSFHICNKLKEKYPGKIILEMAIPFKDQPNAWFNEVDINRYILHKNQADIITYVDELENYKFDRVPTGVYHPAKLQIRNKYMVDNSDLVIAVWDTSPGGTKNCVNYAKKHNKNIISIDTREI